MWPKGFLCLPKELDVTVQGVGDPPQRMLSLRAMSFRRCHCEGGRRIGRTRCPEGPLQSSEWIVSRALLLSFFFEENLYQSHQDGSLIVVGLAFFQVLQPLGFSLCLFAARSTAFTVLTVLKRLLPPSMDFVLGTKHSAFLCCPPWPCEGRHSDRLFQSREARLQR